MAVNFKFVIEAIDKASETLEKVSENTQGLQVVTAAAFIELGRQAIQAGQKLVEFSVAGLLAADRMLDLSKVTGLSVQTLSSLELALTKNGSSINDLATGARVLARQMLDAKDGLAESKRAFDNLGISVTDTNGNLRRLDDVLPEVADAIKNAETETDKLAIAQDLLGRSAGNMVPFLNQGREGIAAARVEAERLGVVLTEDAARAADTFSDNLEDTKAVTAALQRELGIFLLPTLNLVAKGFVELAQQIRGTQNASELATIQFRLQQAELKRSTGEFIAVAEDGNLILQRRLQTVRDLEPENQKLIGFSRAIIGLEKQGAEQRAATTVGLLQQVEREIAAIRERQRAAEEAKGAEVAFLTEKEREAFQEIDGLRNQLATADEARLEQRRDITLRAIEQSVLDETTKGELIAEVSRQYEFRRRDLTAEAELGIALLKNKATADEETRLKKERAIIERAVNDQVITRSKGLQLIAQNEEAMRNLSLQRYQAWGQGIAQAFTNSFQGVIEGQKSFGKALEEGIRDSLLNIAFREIDVFKEKEIGKAIIEAPGSFGLSLLKIPLIVAGAEGAKGVIRAAAFTRFAEGGKVTGGTPGVDSVPILAQPGEVVLPVPVARFFERTFARGGRTGGFQEGGLVGEGGQNVFNIRIDNISDLSHIDRMLEAINDAVQFRGRRLVATEQL